MNDSQHNDYLLHRSQQAIKEVKHSADFQRAMEHFWNKKYDEAADAVSKYLVKGSRPEDLFQSYRLWIECLAIQSKNRELRLIAGHLVQMSLIEEKYHDTFVALSGLAYLECDCFGKSRLLARCVVGKYNNPYVLELIQRLRLRAGFSEKDPIILRCSGPIIDYFHWELISYSLGLMKNPDEDLILRVNKLIKYDFNAKIVGNVLEYHHYLDEELFAGAAVVADILHEEYPHDDDYLVFQGFAYFEDGDYPSARKKLALYVKNNPKCDYRILGLLGVCHGKLGDIETAIEVLEKAIEVGALEGSFISDLMIELATLKDEQSIRKREHSEDDQNREIKSWLIKLNHARYFALMQSPDNVIDRIVLPLGNRAQVGDYVFFAASETVAEEDFWNVVAVYMVDSQAIRHTRFEFITVLKLVSRLPLTIPIDIQVRDEDQEIDSEMLQELGWNFDRFSLKKIARNFGLKVASSYASYPKGYPMRYGLYSLDEGALEIIEKSLESQTESLQDRRQRYLSKRPTA